MIKEKVDENDRKVEEKRAALEIKLNEFNANLAAQEELYNLEEVKALVIYSFN